LLAETGLAILIVDCLLLRIRENFVGGRNFLELFRSFWIVAVLVWDESVHGSQRGWNGRLTRMMLQGTLLVSGFELGVGSIWADLERMSVAERLDRARTVDVTPRIS
jgi:hypothetical protein